MINFEQEFNEVVFETQCLSELSETGARLIFNAGVKAAKQSMQGEAVGAVMNAGGIYVGNLKPGLADGTKLYTHAPDSAARIAELEAGNELLGDVINWLKERGLYRDVDYFGDRPDFAEILTKHELEANKRQVEDQNIIFELQKELEEARKDALEEAAKIVDSWENAASFEGFTTDNISNEIRAAIRQTGADASINIKEVRSDKA